MQFIHLLLIPTLMTASIQDSLLNNYKRDYEILYHTSINEVKKITTGEQIDLDSTQNAFHVLFKMQRRSCVNMMMNILKYPSDVRYKTPETYQIGVGPIIGIKIMAALVLSNCIEKRDICEIISFRNGLSKSDFDDKYNISISTLDNIIASCNNEKKKESAIAIISALKNKKDKEEAIINLLDSILIKPKMEYDLTPRSDVLLPYLNNYIKSGFNNEIRIKAIEVMARLDPAGSVEYIYKYLWDKDKVIRINALECLGHSTNSTLLPIFKYISENDVDGEIRRLSEDMYRYNSTGIKR